ncbi:hypothetical protein LOC54_01630 [Acetobacter sp. AN02]|uniref:F0F1 ATP synthase subunit B family protein n=1 Tax=Acetobacter sp. AN02 TaxID=2894186 RepID=UPI00243449E2|nr:hypothetical protein [Acetobacter sp. AN02]MDG6093823.1 hypothetical protein [Acetobacter sp. AN02]
MKAALTGIVPAVLSGAVLLVAEAPRAYASGMPQLDFANPLTLGQVFWGGVIFLLFFLALRGWALPKVETVLKSRDDRISGDLDLARNAKAEADRAVHELLQARRDAHAEAQAHLEKVVGAERDEAARRLAEMNARLEEEIGAAEAAVAQERSRALSSLRPIAAEAAAEIVGRLTGAQPDQDAVGRALPAHIS